MKHSPARVWIVPLLAVLPLTASAAEITRIASSFDPDDPFGMYLGVSYVREQSKAKIVREAHQNGNVEEVSELVYLMVENSLELEARIGLWRDLEFKYTLPVVFSQNRTWTYSSLSNPDVSTITNNCIQADGALTDQNCLTNGAGERPIFEVPGASYRGGLGNMRFGLAYGIFNERRDPSKPTWIVGVDYEAPTADLHDPTALTSLDERGGVGDRIHKYTFYTTFSKRLGAVDPYFRVHYTLPYKGPGWYSNCDHPDPSRMAVPENCRTGAWTRAETGIKAPHRGGFLFGAEFNAYDDRVSGQKFGIDLRMLANYESESRYYNPLTDAMGKLLSSSDHLEVGGSAALNAWAAEYVGLTARGTLTYVTDRNLTDEQIGKDIDGNGTVDLANREELNPNFDYRVDMVSRRFRASEQYNWRIDVAATFSF